MPEEANGHNDGRSRLDRIEAAMELFVRDHEEFRAEHKLLLRAQVLQQDRLERLDLKFEEIGDKLNGLIAVVESNAIEQAERSKAVDAAMERLAVNIETMRRDTDRRLRRLEDAPPAA